MELSNTKKNHFVPKFYLQSFLNTENTISVGDLRTNQIHTIEQTQLKTIGFKNNLYTLKEKISTQDISFIYKFFRLTGNDKSDKDFIHHLRLLGNYFPPIPSIYTPARYKNPSPRPEIFRSLKYIEKA